MLRLSLKFTTTWDVIDCDFVLDEFTTTQSLFSGKDFRPTLSTASVTLKLGGKLLSQFLAAGDSLPALVENDGQLLFGGFLENVYSAQEHRLLSEEDFYRVTFKIRDWLSWFDFELEEPFNPYFNQSVVETLPVCDPTRPQRSLLHLLWSSLRVPFGLDRDLEIPDLSFSFVIKEKQNVLQAIRDLFWGLGRLVFIDAGGVLQSERIRTASQRDKALSLECVTDFSHTRSKREYTDLQVEYATTVFKARSILLAEKKAIYSEASGTLDKDGKPEPLVRIIPQGDYPAFSTTNEVYHKPKAEFLQTNYTWGYVEEGIFGTSSPRNEDMSVIALWDFDMRWKGDEALEQQYFKTKSDAFAYSFFNPNDLPDDHFEDAVLSLDYFDVYASTLYRTKRNFLHEKTPRSPQRSLGDLESVVARPTYRRQETFLPYVNDSDTAYVFLALHSNHLRHGTITFRFGSLDDLSLNTFYSVTSAGVTFRFLIITKTRNKHSRLIQYEALQEFSQKLGDVEKGAGTGGGEKPTTVRDYRLSNRWDKQDPMIETDYARDESLLPSVDQQAQLFGGRLVFAHSIFFSASHVFQSVCLGVGDAVIRHRPLATLHFPQESTVVIVPRTGVLIHSRVRTEGEAIQTGETPTLFKIS